jgi:predicted acyltransferase (DUF342 family)
VVWWAVIVRSRGGTNVEFIGVRTGANTGLGNGSVVSGTIVANGGATLGTNTTVVGTLDAASLSAGNGSNLQGAVVVSGSLSVGTNGTLANADAATATLGNGTNVLGTLVLPNGINPTLGVGATVAVLENDGDPLPQSPDTFADVVLPPASAYASSASALDDKTVGVNGALILGPGIYRDLSMGNGADISLSAGTYVFRNVNMGTNSLILVDASGGDVTVFVSGNSSIGNGTVVSISGGSAEDFYLETRGIFTGGANLDWYGTIFATKSDSPGQHSISIGNGLDLVGALYSNQQIEIGTNANIAYASSDYLDGPEEPPPPPADAFTLVATKVVCTDESLLPNGNALAGNVNASTAADWVAQNPGCSLASGWEFEWGEGGAGNGGNDTVGPVGGSYNLFGATDSYGTATATIELPVAQNRVEVREVLKAGYVPFSGDNNNEVSARLFCTGDGGNYDNWEWLNNPQDGQTFYCVAFNAPVEQPPQQCELEVSATEIVSGTETQDGEGAASLVTKHNAWTTLSGANWIWSEAMDANNTSSAVGTTTFTHSFNIAGTPLDSSIELAADNGYEVRINGDLICASPDPFNWQATDTCPVPASALQNGANTLTIHVDNHPGNHPNPGGLIYKLIVNQNACVPEAQTSTVTMCKLDNNEQPLSGWTLMLKGADVGTYNVPVNDPAGISTDPLTNGVSYIAMAVGTWLNSGQAGNYVDAEYSTQDNWVTQYDGFPGYSDEILELQINEQFGAYWGAYNSAHTYAQMLMGNGGPANFRIYDGHPVPTLVAGWYNDNTESTLKVMLSEGYAGITEDNGCVVFEDVPYGTYTVEEIMQDGWSNVSGLGEVEVNEPSEVFEIVNTQAETFDIVVTKYVCPADTNLSRGTNGPAADGNHTEGEGCVLQEGANFGYHLWADQDGTGEPYAYDQDFSGTSQSTDVDGVTIFSNLVKDGRYDIAELDSEGNRIADTDDLGSETEENPVLGLYCTTDPGLAEDNLDFVIASQVEGDTAYCVVYNAPKAQQCDAEVEVLINSDTNTKINAIDGASIVTFLHDAWLVVNAPLYWIWSDSTTSEDDAANGATETFIREFEVVGTPSNAFIDIAADNSYEVRLNGNPVPGCANAGEFNYSATTTCSIPVDMFALGNNELEIEVTNMNHPDANTPETNPAGLVYQLYFVDNQCEIPETGTIIINKQTEGGDGTFDFTLYDVIDEETDTWVETDNASISTVENEGTTSFTNLSAGNYAVDEDTQENWSNFSNSCTSNIPDKPQNNEFISLAAGETVTCTFLNIYDDEGGEGETGSITIVKNALGGDATFSFMPSGGVGFNVGFEIDTAADENDSEVFSGLAAGVYSVSEISLPANWTLTNTECSDGSPVNAIDLSAGENVTCTFTNTFDENGGGDGPQSLTTGGGDIAGGFGGFQPFGEVLGASTDECVEYLHEYIRYGGNNNPAEVLKLQVFLNDFEANNLTLSGIYDDASHQAVHAFQRKYAGMVLTPWGATRSTGYVYHTTKKTINEIYCRFTKLFPLSGQQEAEIARVRAMGEAWNSGIGNTGTSGQGSAPFAPTNIQLPPAAPTAPQAPQETPDIGASDTGAGEVAGAQTKTGFWSKLWNWLTGR